MSQQKHSNLTSFLDSLLVIRVPGFDHLFLEEFNFENSLSVCWLLRNNSNDNFLKIIAHAHWACKCARLCATHYTNMRTFNPHKNLMRSIQLWSSSLRSGKWGDRDEVSCPRVQAGLISGRLGLWSQGPSAGLPPKPPLSVKETYSLLVLTDVSTRQH